MEDESQLSEQESLRLISEMIGKAKKSYVTKGIASMVWGVLIVTCSLLTWAQVQYKFVLGFDVWVLVFIAVIPQIYFSIKEKKQKHFTAHDEPAIRYLWTTFGICIFILTFYNSHFGGNESTSLYMMLYGIPTFITGGIFKFKPMIIGGLICWILSVISIFTPLGTDMLFMAACGLFAWLIPGIILWSKYQKQQARNV
ncbi:MAG: hypothetical protein ABJA37_03145 [Ferruginibacter sp.]